MPGREINEPIEVAGRDAVKPLPPFEAIPFQAQRRFMLAEMIRGAPR